MPCRLRSAALAAVSACLICACASVGAPAPSATDPASGSPTSAAATTAAPAPLLLVSIDGFRADYLDRGFAPHLRQWAHEGVRAQWMTPSYPSLTFPNHYTLVTGLRPDRHGIVHNTMWDESLGGFALSKREAVGNGAWWHGEPLWVGAEKAGLRTATMFWPGSEAAIHGIRPQRWHAYDATVTSAARVDTVLGWLSEPEATRPRLATLYFDRLDKAAHEHGPESPEAREALRDIDAQLGRLRDGLVARGLIDTLNVVVVSDHGMAPVPAEHQLDAESMVSPSDARLVASGESVGFEPLPGRRAEAEAKLLGRHRHYQCWRKDALPAQWHYGRNARVPSIVCQMDEGWSAQPAAVAAKRRQMGPRGAHGYDPALPSMRAIFIARGPAFARGRVLPPVDNVDVYALLARLLGIPAAPNDGRAGAFDAALVPAAGLR
jgi:predicted AlkP superfamily pyrophosphatase or phosphodiesterase